MKENTVILELEEYNRLMSVERDYESLSDDYVGNLNEILNGTSVELIKPIYHTNVIGQQFIVQNGSNFYSASDANEELAKELKEMAESFVEAKEHITKLENQIRRNRTWSDKILGR